MLKRAFLVLSLLWGSQFAFGQDRESVIQQRIEFISEQLESEDIDLTNLMEILYYRIEHPLNLNAATRQDLAELNLLTEVQISDLLLHREKFGKLISIYELQALKYWSLQTIQLVLPFVRVDDRMDQLHITWKNAIKNGKFELWGRYQRVLEHKKGYDNVPDSILYSKNSYYHGNPDRYYTRLRYTYSNNISIGMTGEKDPGEKFFKGYNKQGFDFYSFHAFYKGGKYVKAVALGDYQIQIGQGLNLWSGYAFRKTADAVNVKKNANPIRPYTSVDETRFLRGAAADFGYKNFSLLVFGSVKRVDATTYVDSLNEEMNFASSINLTGFHRTNSEIARKNALQERIAGGNLRYDKGNLHVGVAGIYWGYDQAFEKEILPYNQFDFRGKSNMSFSGDYSYTIKNVMLFGEASYTHFSKSFANIHGALIALDSRATLSLVYRDYARGYETFYNNGFAEGSQTQNEKGMYAGLNWQLAKKWTLNTYFDYFRFPWMRYTVNAPSRGIEYLIQPTYRPNKQLEIYARVRHQQKEGNVSNNLGGVKNLVDIHQTNYRLALSYKVSETITLKSRIDYVTYKKGDSAMEQGVSVAQDIVYKPKKFPLDVTLRYALFDTDSYNSRIYAFEQNALYVFSIPAYYNQGHRAYVLLRLTCFRQVDIWARYALFMYNNVNRIGTGPEQIVGQNKTELTLQLRWKF